MPGGGIAGGGIAGGGIAGGGIAGGGTAGGATGLCETYVGIGGVGRTTGGGARVGCTFGGCNCGCLCQPFFIMTGWTGWALMRKLWKVARQS